MTGYANEIYTCAVCSKTFPKYTVLKRHLLTEHSKGHVFSCEYCDRQFSQKCNMQRHARMHTGERPFNCAICLKGFTQKGNLERHMAIHTGNKRYACNFCDKRFAQNGNLKTHLLRHTGDRPFKCHVCNKGFAVKGNLEMHLIRHTNDQCFICEICNEGFLSENKYKKHMLTHNVAPVYTCQVCLDNFESEALLTEHMSIHSSHPREASDRKKTNSALITNDINSLERKHIDLFICDICNEGYFDKNQFRNHVLTHSEQRISKANKNDKNNKYMNNSMLDAPYTCGTCGSKYTKKYNLNRHLLTHLDEYYTCNVCGDKFNHQSNFKRHLAMHDNTTSYKCGFCTKEFLQKSNLQRHISTQHPTVHSAVVEDLYPINDQYVSNIDDPVKTEFYDESQSYVVYDNELSSESVHVELGEMDVHKHEDEQSFIYEQKVLTNGMIVNDEDIKPSIDNELYDNTNKSKTSPSVTNDNHLSSRFEIYEDELCHSDEICVTTNEDNPSNYVSTNSQSDSPCLWDVDCDLLFMCEKCGENFKEHYKLEQHLLTHNDDAIIVIVV